MHCNYPTGAGAVLVIELDGAADRGRAGVRRGRAAVPRERRLRAAGRHRPRRAGPDLEGPQVRLRGGRPDQPRLHRPGRRHPAHRAARGAPGHRRAVRRPRASGSPTSSTPATATCTRWCSSTTRSRAPATAAEEVSGAILDLCIQHGGSITGEHGVGMDKATYMPRMYTEEDLDTMQLVRCAFDPHEHLQPRQGLPDAAAVRRGARAAQGRRTRCRRPDWRRCSDADAPRLADAAREAVGSARARSATPEPRDAVDGVVPGARRAPRRRPSRSPRCCAPRPRTASPSCPRGRGTKLSWGRPADLGRRAPRPERRSTGSSTTPPAT